MNVSCVTNKTAAPQRKILVFFLQDALKINASIDAHKEDTFFQNQGTFFLFSKKGRGDLPLPLVVARLRTQNIRNCMQQWIFLVSRSQFHIPFFTVIKQISFDWKLTFAKNANLSKYLDKQITQQLSD